MSKQVQVPSQYDGNPNLFVMYFKQLERDPRLKLQGIGEKTQDARISSLEELELQISNKIASDPVVDQPSTIKNTSTSGRTLDDGDAPQAGEAFYTRSVIQEILRSSQNTAHANSKRSSGLIGNPGLLQVILMVFLALKRFLRKSEILGLKHSASSMFARNESSRLFLTHFFLMLINLMTQKLQ